MLRVFNAALILIIKKLLPSICPGRDGEGQQEGMGLSCPLVGKSLSAPT